MYINQTIRFVSIIARFIDFLFLFFIERSVNLQQFNNNNNNNKREKEFVLKNVQELFFNIYPKQQQLNTIAIITKREREKEFFSLLLLLVLLLEEVKYKKSKSNTYSEEETKQKQKNRVITKTKTKYYNFERTATLYIL